jgi:branched-chain amino acid transport system substrate-binding protein
MELVATQGVYNMTPAYHSVFDQRGRVLLAVRDGK